MVRVETRSAVVEKAGPELVVCRYRHGVKVTAAAVRENLEARLTLVGKEPYAVIGIFPEDVDFDMSLLEENHYTDIVLNAATRVLALVAEGDLFEPIAKLYLAYHPTQFESAVFPTEAEAMAWVNERINAHMKEHR